MIICSLSNRKELYSLTFPRFEDYCKKYEYEYILKQNPHISNKNRHISWEKIKLLINFWFFYST